MPYNSYSPSWVNDSSRLTGSASIVLTLPFVPASDQWNGFHHAPHPDDEEDDDWYYDDESDYHHQLADQHLAPPPPPPPPAPNQHQSTNMLHYQSFAQPAPQPKVRVDMSRVSYSTWQNPWQSALRYQNQGAGPSAYGGYSPWNYQDQDDEEDQEECALTNVVSQSLQG